MKPILPAFFLFCCFSAFIVPAKAPEKNGSLKRYLYAAVPGIRDYMGYGGHGLLVFNIDNHHRFVKRIPTQGLHSNGKPSNVKGIAVSIPLNSIFISTLETLQRIDLATDKIIWEKKFEKGCDRMSVSPDGPCTCPRLKTIPGTYLIVKPET